MGDRTLTVRVIGDDRDLQRTFDRSAQGAKRFERSVEGVNLRTAALGQSLRGGLSRAGGGLGGGLLFGSGAFVGTALATATIVKTTQAASDLNEEISKSKQIFGQSADAVKVWSETTATGLGISQVEALRATGIFGNLFRTIGLAPTQSATLSKSLVQLASDLASFNNADPSEVLDALRSGLVGEAEPLRRFGVLLSETRVQQQALTDTGKSSVKSLTDQEKALARYEIIMRDTTSAQGDFARTSGGLANQTRILKAQLADLAANVGTTFLPAILRATIALNDMFAVMSKLNKTPFGHTISLEGVSLDKLTDARDRIAEIRGETDLLVVALDKAIALLGATQAQGNFGPDQGPQGGPQRAAAIIAAIQASKAAEATAAEKAATKAFNEHIAGLGLKLDKAALDSSETNDLAVLAEIERSILRRERAIGKTFALEKALTQVRAQRAAIVDRLDADASAKEKDAADRAKQRRADARARARAAAEAAAADRIGDQFSFLGLTREGQERTPPSGSLRKRANRLEDQIKGTILDTAQTRRELDHIEAVLSGKFGEVGRNVRQAIQAMLNEIAQALHGDAGDRKGPITAFRVANFSEIAKQFPSLSPDDADRLRQILSRRGAGGTIASGSRVGGAFGFDAGGAGGGPARAEIHVTVELDGKVIARAVANENEKQSQRRSGQRSGVRPGARR
jgi:hypothetical protein